jgi:hypothetical protein
MGIALLVIIKNSFLQNKHLMEKKVVKQRYETKTLLEQFCEQLKIKHN